MKKNKKIKVSKILFENNNLDNRLNCFGSFNNKDKICLKHCALNINCVIAKNNFFNFQFIDDNLSSILNDKNYDG